MWALIIFIPIFPNTSYDAAINNFLNSCFLSRGNLQTTALVQKLRALCTILCTGHLFASGLEKENKNLDESSKIRNQYDAIEQVWFVQLLQIKGNYMLTLKYQLLSRKTGRTASPSKKRKHLFTISSSGCLKIDVKSEFYIDPTSIVLFLSVLQSREKKHQVHDCVRLFPVRSSYQRATYQSHSNSLSILLKIL